MICAVNGEFFDTLYFHRSMPGCIFYVSTLISA